MSAAEGVPGFEIAVLPPPERAGPLRLLAPWRKDEWKHPDEAEALRLAEPAPARPAFDRRSAATALLLVIREWRAVARELEGIDPGSRDRALLEAEDAVLRSVHHRLFGQLRREDSET